MNAKRILSKITAMTLAGAILFGDVVPVFANSQVEDATVIEESVADDSNTEGIQIKEESSSDSSVGDSDASTEESSQDFINEENKEIAAESEVSEEAVENNDFLSEDVLENTPEEPEDTPDENTFCSHEFSYNDNGDGTHTTVCLLCENFEPVTESHTFNESGLCVCGVIKENEAETEAEDSKQIQSVTYENSFENKAETDSIIVSVFAEAGALPDCTEIDVKLEEIDGKTEVFLLPGFKDDCSYDLDNSVFENCSLQVTVESKDEQNSIVSVKKGDNEIAFSNEGTVSFEVNDFESFSVFLSSGFVDTTLQTEVGEASVSISGEMPEGAEIKTVPVSSVRKYESLVKENGFTFSVIWACDISIEVDGEPWQPVDDGKTVTVEVSGIDLNANCDSVDVYRIEDTEEEATKLSSDVNSEENTVSFETEHFTVFTVGSTNYNSSDSTEFAVGDSITGYLFSDGTLILDGSGATYDYENTTSIFYNNANIKKVVVNEGITTLGAYLFQSCSNLKSVSLSEGITTIKQRCFDSSALSGTLVFPSTLIQIGAFSFNNTSISEVVINSTVTGAYDMVAPYPSFSNCNNLTTATYNEGVTNTGAKLFLECYSLTTVNLPSTIKNIGSRSFNSCVNLKSFPFNEGIVSIYDAAFEGSGLSGNITLPTTLANTYYDAFKNCDSLTSVTVQSVIKAGQGMINDCATFAECDNLTTFTFTDGISSTGTNLCRGMKNLTTVNLADSVTTIGTGTFCDTASLPSIDLNNVTTINAYSFKNCTSLSSVGSSNQVTNLGNQAFYNCTNLGSFTFPCIKTIGDQTFYNCINLGPTVEFPSSLTSIAANGFDSCTGINKVVFNSNATGGNNTSYPSFNGCSNLSEAVFNSGVTTVGNYILMGATGLTNVTIADTVTQIGSRSFYKAGINAFGNTLTIPDTWTSIGSEAFYNVSGIATISGGNGLTSVGNNSFYVASNVDTLVETGEDSVLRQYAWAGSNRTVTFDPALDYTARYKLGDDIYGYWYADTGILVCDGTGAMYDWSDNQNPIGANLSLVKEIEVKDGITSLGNKFTYYNSSNYAKILTDVTLPSTLTKIGSYAFSNALKLENVTFADGISSLLLGNYCFNGCKALTTITLPEGTTSVPSYAFQNCTALESITLPSTCTAINSYAFSGCTKLASIAWPGVKTISNDAFSGCTALGPTLEFPASCRSLGASTFKGCTGITKLVFNGSTAGANNTSWPSFVNCSNITEVVFNEGVTGVGDYLLIGRNSITSVALPSTLTSVGISSFYNCTNVFADGLVLPNGVETIGKNAFYGNTALTEITVPKSVTSIGSRAFYVSNATETVLHTRNTVAKGYNWTGDKRTVTIPPQQYVLNTAGDLIGTLDDTGKLSITGTGTNLDKCLSTVLGDDASELTSLSFDTDTIEVIRSNWCYNEDSVFPELTGNLVLPDKLKKIGSFAFRDCSGFTGNLVLPDKLKEIGSFAFMNCSGFTGNLVLPNNLVTIGINAFEDCSGFTGNLVIPDSVTEIGYCAFYYCYGFDGTLTLGNHLQIIGSFAFGNDNFTGDLIIPDSVTTIGELAFYSCSGLKDITIGIGVTTIGLNAFKALNKTDTVLRTSNEVAKAYDWDGSNRILSYEVIYKDYSGDNALYTEVVRSGKTAVYVNDSVYEWVTEANGTAVADLSNVTDFVTVYGFPAVNVTFKSYDGTVTYCTERIKKGGSPSYTNSDVAEWYTEANGSTVANLTSVSADVTVFGKKACSYKVKVPLTVDMQYDSSRNVAEKDFSVSLEYTIPDDGTISVYVGDSRDFKVSIANTTDPSKTISADVSYENNSFTMANGTAQEDGSRISDNTWTISASDIPVAGEYKGTMRFVIEYQE